VFDIVTTCRVKSKVAKFIRCVLVGIGFVLRFRVVTKSEETFSECRVIEVEVIVNLLSDRLSNTWKLYSLLTTAGMHCVVIT
jgi:hypothetical protein